MSQPNLTTIKALQRMLFMAMILGITFSCNKTVIVHQNEQSYNDYKAHKYKKLENKTKPSKYSKKKNKW